MDTKIAFHFNSANAALKIDGHRVDLAGPKDTKEVMGKDGRLKTIEGFVAQDGTFFQVKQGEKAKNGGIDIIVRGTPEQVASYDFGVKNGSVSSARYGENSYRPGGQAAASDFTIQSGTSGEEILREHGLAEKQPAKGKGSAAPPQPNSEQEIADSITKNRNMMREMMKDVPRVRGNSNTPSSPQSADKTEAHRSGDILRAEAHADNNSRSPAVTQEAIQSEARNSLMRLSEGIADAKAERPDIQRQGQRLEALASGSVFEHVSSQNLEFQQKLLESAAKELQSINGEIDAILRPRVNMSEIEQYPEVFETVCATYADKIDGMDSLEWKELRPANLLEQLSENGKTELLSLFEQSLSEHLHSLSESDFPAGQSLTPKQRSQELLQNLGLARKESPENGHCFFHSLAATEPGVSDHSLPTEANHQRNKLIEKMNALPADQSAKLFPGQELYKTWEALVSGFPAENNRNVDSTAWGTASHLKLYAMAENRSMIAVDAADNRVDVYLPNGSSLNFDLNAGTGLTKTVLQNLIKDEKAGVLEILPNHWNAAVALP